MPGVGNSRGGHDAEGIDHRYPGYGLWIIMLVVSFLVLYPGQILSGDTVPRRWCDIIWTASARARRLSEKRVKEIYYGLMSTDGGVGAAGSDVSGATRDSQDRRRPDESGPRRFRSSRALRQLHAASPEVRPNWFIRAGVVFAACSSSVSAGLCSCRYYEERRERDIHDK